MAEARIVRSSEGDVYERLWLFKHGSLNGGRFDFMVGNIGYLAARRFTFIVTRTTRFLSSRACLLSRSVTKCSTSGRVTSPLSRRAYRTPSITSARTSRRSKCAI